MDVLNPISVDELTSSEILEESAVDRLKKEAEFGVDVDNHQITAFKIQQRILEVKTNSSLSVGGFLNGNSNTSNFSSKYEVVLLSNRFEIITTPEGKEIRKRFGYGFGFTLNVSNIKTKLGFNYGIVAASTALDLAKAGYELVVNGVTDAKLAENMPDNTGDFTNNIYGSLIKFIDAAKQHLTSNPINKLFPIEILNRQSLSSEVADFRSIYFGAKKVAQQVKLTDAINLIRSASNSAINENTVQFMYGYFGIDNAYTTPTDSQKNNASKWLSGTFNKVAEFGINHDSWVTIDPATENGKFIALSGLPNGENYQPHPLPADWATSAKSLKDTFSEVSLDFSSSLKIASIVDVSGKFNVVTITRDISLSAPVSANPVPGSKVLETSYGVGVRLTLRVSNVEFGTKINFATVGAASEMGYANVEYEITGLGISDPNLLKDFPGPLDINQDTVSQINAAFNGLKTKLSTMDVSELRPQPFRIRVAEPEKIDPTLPAQAFIYSIGKISSKVKLKDAIAEGAPIGIKRDGIVAAYKQLINISDENEKIRNEHKHAAEDWLRI